MSLDTMAGKHYQESSPCHKEDAHTATGDHLVHLAETTVKQDHPASLNIDHDLDMSQLCKAFAEDFTQEVNLLRSPQESAQGGHDRVLVPSCATMEISEMQPETESAMQSDEQVDHQKAEMHNLTNIQSLESATCDSGCPTVHSGFSLETPLCSGAEQLHSGFKTANNKIIVISPEALEKAKAALDEPLEHMTHKGTSGVTEPTKANPNQCKSYKPVLASTSGESPDNYKHGREAGRETSDESVLRSEAAAKSLPSTFMCQTNESGFKTASDKSITVSSVNLEKAKDIFMELDEEKFDSWLSNNEVQVCSGKAAKPSEDDLKNSLKPSRHLTGNGDGSSSLTASQKADVTELCSMLEEAGSQCEFTQFNHTKTGTKCPDSLQLEREWDPEILAGIDFDDSFNFDLTERQLSKKHQPKADVHASVPNSVTNGDASIKRIIVKNPCEIRREMTNMADESMQEKSFRAGFKTAKGNTVIISESCLRKARSLFADIGDGESNGSDCKAGTVNQMENQSGDRHDKSCGVAVESELELKPGLDPCNGNASSITKEAEMCKTSLETVQGFVDQEPDLIPSKTVNFGFSTAGGKEVKISEKALQNAKKLLNEVADDKEPRRDDSPAKTKATSWTNVLANVLHDSKMSDGPFPKGGKEQHFENSADIKQATYPTPRSVESPGFKMASGKGVTVSASAVQKSRSIFKDIDDGGRRSDETNPKRENAKLDLEGDTGQPTFVNGFKMASGKGVSFSEKEFMKAKTFFKSCDPDCMDISQVKRADTGVMDDRGSEAVAGNAAHLSGMDHLNKETLKKDSADLNKYVQRKFSKTSTGTLELASGCGFTTASGAPVSVSTEALQRAKAVLDDSDAGSPGERRLEISEEKGISKIEPVISGKTCGFSTVSGREVAVSEKALQKAASLCNDCDVGGLGSDLGNMPTTKTSATAPEHIQLPFSAASNKHIAVSGKEINKDKDGVVSCDHVSFDTPNSESTLTVQSRQDKNYSSEALSSKDEHVPATAGKSEARHENMMNGGPQADTLGPGNFGFSSASGKGVRVSKSALEVAFEMFRDCDAQPVPNGQCEISSGGPSANIKQTPVVPKTKATSAPLPSQATWDNPAVLTCHALNLDGCTVTQQKYFEQEAMACTKALLEDDLNENGLLSTLDTGIRQSPTLGQERCLGVKTGMRKRTSDDMGLTGKACQL